MKFEEVVNSTIDPKSLVPEIIIDAEILFSDIKTSFYNILQQMEPFGPENMRPVFIAKNIIETGYSKIVKEQHVRFVLKQNDITFTGIGFNMADKYELLQTKKPLDIVFKCIDPCSCQVTSLPHSTAKNFTKPPGFFNKIKLP